VQVNSALLLATKRYKQVSDDRATINICAEIGRQKPTLRKIKRAGMQLHKPTQITAHLILPNRTRTISGLTIWRQLLTENGFKIYIYDLNN